MAIKIKLKTPYKETYKNLFEALGNNNEVQEEISDLWREIRSQTDPLGKMQNNIVAQNGSLDKDFVDVSKLVRLKDSKSGIVINPKEIAEEAEDILKNQIHNYSSINGLKDISEYWQYPIIWTIDSNCPTACTDGLRIAMNPFFYNRIRSTIAEDYEKNHKDEQDTYQNRLKRKLNDMIPFLFVIVHEAYHQIYKHIARERIATFVPKTRDGHMNANYAQDAEINRDICYNEFPLFKKVLSMFGFVDESDKFPYQDWEDIYQAFESGEETPKFPGYFEKKNSDSEIKWDNQNQSKPVPTQDWNNGYSETWNRLSDVWNKTKDPLEVMKEFEKIKEELSL